MHPYLPTTLALPAYVPPEQSALALCAAMGAAVAAVLAAACVVLRRRGVSGGDLGAALWFVLSGSMHCTFELYYVVASSCPGGIAARRDVAASLWKEYALSDSRYVAGAAAVRVQEAATVLVIGPLCWLAVAGICARRGCLRDLAQLAASVLHVQSVLLYYGAELAAPASACRPEPRYYYGYFVGANLPWLVVPLVLAARSAARISRQMAVAKRAEK
ncbi:hypothetical protein IWW54_003363, partial [Coemansia sp. RSA 2705]